MSYHRPSARLLHRDRGLTRNEYVPQARLHGNKPAKGAVIDKELQEEDEAMLRKKGDSMAGKKY